MVTEGGIKTVANPLQFIKAFGPIDKRPGWRLTVVNALQSEKVFFVMVVTSVGMVIEMSLLHALNAL